jgi:hypothetical protein
MPPYPLPLNQQRPPNPRDNRRRGASPRLGDSGWSTGMAVYLYSRNSSMPTQAPFATEFAVVI